MAIDLKLVQVVDDLLAHVRCELLGYFEHDDAHAAAQNIYVNFDWHLESAQNHMTAANQLVQQRENQHDRLADGVRDALLPIVASAYLNPETRFAAQLPPAYLPFFAIPKGDGIVTDGMPF